MAVTNRSPFLGSNGRFVLGLVAAFFLCNLWAVLGHALWRDEWHVWLTTYDSSSLRSMYEHCAHAGRPLGWYFLAWLVVQLGFYPLGLKLFHVLVSTLCIFVFARYSPFTRMQKVLFAFSYYPFYEYGTIMRDYAFEMLLLFVTCIVFAAPRRRPILFGCMLALLFQTHSMGILLGLALGAAYLFDLWWRGDPRSSRLPVAAIACGMGIAIVSLVLAYIVMRPAYPDWVYLGPPPPESSWLARAAVTMGYLWRSFCPIPFQGHWNSNLLDAWPWLQSGLGCAVVVSLMLLLAKRPTALVFYAASIAALVTLYCQMGALYCPNAMRYHGHFFMALVAAFWLAASTRAGENSRTALRTILDCERFRPALLTGVLSVHVVVAAIAVAQEQVIPFSGSREAARIIQAAFPPDVPVIGDCDYTLASVQGYLQRPVYYACRREYCNYFKLDDKRSCAPLPPEVLSRILADFVAHEKREVALVVNYPLRVSSDRIELVATINDSIAATEVFMIFRVKPPVPGL
jgi:hypothetical protein